ncbi:hypothetical protein C8R47DRAFT_1072886 [Mycena vitilis]|nr:hypothetical protein C8R47DRAFT_1072886 [Mycena vitilis]
MPALLVVPRRVSRSSAPRHPSSPSCCRTPVSRARSSTISTAHPFAHGIAHHPSAFPRAFCLRDPLLKKPSNSTSVLPGDADTGDRDTAAAGRLKRGVDAHVCGQEVVEYPELGVDELGIIDSGPVYWTIIVSAQPTPTKTSVSLVQSSGTRTAWWLLSPVSNDAVWISFNVALTIPDLALVKARKPVALTSRQLPPACDVPLPRMAELPPLPDMTAVRSGSVDKAFRESVKFQAWSFLNNADVFVTKKTLEELAARPKNTKKEIRNARDKIESLNQQDPRSQSAIYIDCNGKVLLGYFAHRFTRGIDRVKTLTPQSTEAERSKFLLKKAKPIKQQYDNATRAEMSDNSKDYTYDGLPVAGAAHRPVADPRDIRHRVEQGTDLLEAITMAYPTPTVELNPFPAQPEQTRLLTAMNGRVEQPVSEDGEPKSGPHVEIPPGATLERNGVLHFTSSWCQQGTSVGDKLDPSTDINAGGAKTRATRYYFLLTQEAAAFVEGMFKALFPEYHAMFAADFKRGVWLTEDKGPFLGRAVVSKLQVGIHRDSLDDGPAATFPSGWYRAGDLCICMAHALYHSVSHWKPVAPPLHLQKQAITPGRISTVFFSPAKSRQTLAGKEDNYMVARGGGMYPSVGHPGSSTGSDAAAEKKREKRKAAAEEREQCKRRRRDVETT